MTNIQAPEVADATLGMNPNGGAPATVTVSPTQVRKPWRTTARTLFQSLVALATLLPFVVAGVYTNAEDYPAVVTQVLGVSAAVARVMALPQVEEFLRQFLPFLSASGKQPSL